MRATSRASRPAGSDAVSPARLHERVPEFERVFGAHPDLVSQITRVAGPRDRDRHRSNGALGEPEIGDRGDVRAGHQLGEQIARGRALEGERRQIERDVAHAGVHPQRAVLEPAQARIRGRDAEVVRPQTLHGAVVDQLARLVAPRAVQHLPLRTIGCIAGDDAVHQRGRIRAGNLVLAQGRDVEERRSAANRVVLVLVAGFVAEGDGVPGPVAPAAVVAEGGGPGVEGRLKEHAASWLRFRNAARW